MPMQDYVYNPVAILSGTGIMLLCLVVQAFAVVIVMNGAKSRINTLVQRRHHLRAQAVFFVGAVALLASHLLQIFIWGLFLSYAGIIVNEHQAMLFGGSTYTTVGFVNDPLPTRWQITAIIMATNGFFSFAWSTTAMVRLSYQLYPLDSGD